MERLISALGLLVLLGLAYVFSKNRRAVNFRTVVLGVSLQLLFAVIILSEGQPSFIGMFALVFLVLLYLFEGDFRQRQLPAPATWLLTLAVAAGGVAVAKAAAPTGAPGLLALGAALVLAVNVRLRHEQVGRWAFSLLIIAGLGKLWADGIDGRKSFEALSAGVKLFLELSVDGAAFLFGNLANAEHFFVDSSSPWPGFGFQFAFSVLPTIIF
ncbi:MAG: Na+ dependent nucleoside transporter N-terminal domain-containing protein, partial [Acidobacteriota bacterium]